MRTHLDLITFAVVTAMTAACSSGGSEATASTSTGAGGETTSTSGGTASTGTGSASSSVIATGLFHPNDLALFDVNVYRATQNAGAGAGDAAAHLADLLHVLHREVAALARGDAAALGNPKLPRATGVDGSSGRAPGTSGRSSPRCSTRRARTSEHTSPGRTLSRTYR